MQPPAAACTCNQNFVFKFSVIVAPRKNQRVNIVLILCQLSGRPINYSFELQRRMLICVFPCISCSHFGSSVLPKPVSSSTGFESVNPSLWMGACYSSCGQVLTLLVGRSRGRSRVARCVFRPRYLLLRRYASSC